ncbi:YdaE family protein [Enterobacter ludwigii]|uniref:YdaE family protein n=1 Tax=Enterobacter ludwigii TaxID=299767 RepID=UPI002A832682|nr:YdaE family protein [Enterobacter ludwigii]
MRLTLEIKCAYHLCNKLIEENKSIERNLYFLQGVATTTELRKYCSERCAEHDQMAHEP